MRDVVSTKRITKKRQKRVRQVISALGNMKGSRAEQKFLEAWQPKWRNRQPQQQWFESIRAATLKEESKGIDAIISTKIPCMPYIPIQVKSSYSEAQKFKERKLNIPLVVVLDSDTKKSIRRSTVAAMVEVFPNLHYSLTQRGCQPPSGHFFKSLL